MCEICFFFFFKSQSKLWLIINCIPSVEWLLLSCGLVSYNALPAAIWMSSRKSASEFTGGSLPNTLTCIPLCTLPEEALLEKKCCDNWHKEFCSSDTNYRFLTQLGEKNVFLWYWLLGSLGTNSGLHLAAQQIAMASPHISILTFLTSAVMVKTTNNMCQTYTKLLRSV